MRTIHGGFPRFLLVLAMILPGAACLTAGRPDRPPPPGAQRNDGSGIPPERRIETFDPPSGPETSAAQGGTNVRVNQDASGRNQNETTIATNPVDPSNLVGGANDARGGSWAAGVYVSHDGGASWTDGVMPFRKHPNQGDPTIAFCGDGTVLYGYLDYVGSYQPHRLIVGRSDDGGTTWQGPGVVHEGSVPFADKPYLACAPDDGSAYANRAYISWTHFSFGSSPIRVAYSTDRGLSWTGARSVSGSGVQGSVPVAGRNGAVWVFWNAGGSIRFAHSPDGGVSWEPEAAVATIDGIGDSPSFRRNSFPTAAVDVSGGPHDGNLYVAWADQRHGDPDILFSRSTDGGATWSAPLRVNDDPVGNGRDQFFPWMAVDEEGRVHLMWHDQRLDAENRRYHVFIATSRDGGVAFDANLQVTDLASDGSRTGFLGDYAALSARGGTITPLWSDLRAGTGEEDVYIEVEPAFSYDIVRGVRIGSDRQTVSFDDQNPRLGPGISYDALRGDVADLAGADPWSLAVCEAENLPPGGFSFSEIPPPGHAWYLLVRAQGPRGEGSWGSSTGHPDARDGFDDQSPCG